ncbi:hypothetical protein Fcan01_28125 [Folsomia candida]|uniref:Uncharacterized protein n=1 Tax=Folsomia candida TaxID=158441 RepID=A0A226CWI2_FOLCA|nr:hypothetical protein Fcan01_28125 [Folsomia candida]
MPPVTARDSVKGAFYAPRHGYKVINHFCDNFKGIRENSEIPKLHEKGKPKSCMSCQMPPVTARDSGKGAFYAPRSWLQRKAKSCMSCQMPPVTARDSVKGAFYALGHGYKSETEHFCDNFKGIRENSKYRNYMKRENLNLVCPAKCHPLQLETPERARCTPLGVDLKVYNQL